jgi:hypothetical protein
MGPYDLIHNLTCILKLGIAKGEYPNEEKIIEVFS